MSVQQADVAQSSIGSECMQSRTRLWPHVAAHAMSHQFLLGLLTCLYRLQESTTKSCKRSLSLALRNHDSVAGSFNIMSNKSTSPIVQMKSGASLLVKGMDMNVRLAWMALRDKNSFSRCFSSLAEACMPCMRSLRACRATSGDRQGCEAGCHESWHCVQKAKKHLHPTTNQTPCRIAEWPCTVHPRFYDYH